MVLSKHEQLYYSLEHVRHNGNTDNDDNDNEEKEMKMILLIIIILLLNDEDDDDDDEDTYNEDNDEDKNDDFNIDEDAFIMSKADSTVRCHALYLRMPLPLLEPHCLQPSARRRILALCLYRRKQYRKMFIVRSSILMKAGTYGLRNEYVM